MALPLTAPDRKLAEMQSRTVHGMAFWAGSGPLMMTCRQCVFWQHAGYYAGGKGAKPAKCRKYTQLMQGEPGGVIPHHTSACKYFEENKSAPGAFSK